MAPSKLWEPVKNERGQGLLEAVMISAALATFVVALILLLYFAVIRIGAQYLLHEYLVCRWTSQNSLCSQEFHRKSRHLLKGAAVLVLENRERFGSQQARLVLQMPLQRTLTLKKSLGM